MKKSDLDRLDQLVEDLHAKELEECKRYYETPYPKGPTPWKSRASAYIWGDDYAIDDEHHEELESKGLKAQLDEADLAKALSDPGNGRPIEVEDLVLDTGLTDQDLVDNLRKQFAEACANGTGWITPTVNASGGFEFELYDGHGVRHHTPEEPKAPACDCGAVHIGFPQAGPWHFDKCPLWEDHR